MFLLTMRFLIALFISTFACPAVFAVHDSTLQIRHSISERWKSISVTEFDNAALSIKAIQIMRPSPSKMETAILRFNVGAGHDLIRGGFLPRISLLAMVLELSKDAQNPFPVIAHASIGGSHSSLHLRFHPRQRREVFQSISTLLKNGPSHQAIVDSIARESKRSTTLLEPCSCLSDCSCSPLEQTRRRLIEAIDPLPHGSTRFGNPKMLPGLEAEEVIDWINNWMTGGELKIESQSELAPQIWDLLLCEDIRISRFPHRAPRIPPARKILGSSIFMIPPTFANPWNKAPNRILFARKSDDLTPRSCLPLLEERVAIWHIEIQEDESPSSALLRLKGTRRKQRINKGLMRTDGAKFSNTKNPSPQQTETTQGDSALIAFPRSSPDSALILQMYSAN
ncbi:MAG: hypothetical protein GWP39_10270 [Planctomycetia bacterium]|nr:hypothetical protein [Planctomycetia bacterium]